MPYETFSYTKVMHIYSLPLNNTGFRSPDPPQSWKSTYTFWLAKTSTATSLQLPGRLTNNIKSQLIHILYIIYYTLYCYSKIS